jgi:hypothetical protein
MELGFELRHSNLQSSCSTAQATPPVHFSLVILEIGSHELFPWADLKTMTLPISGSQITSITGVNYHAQ